MGFNSGFKGLMCVNQHENIRVEVQLDFSRDGSTAFHLTADRDMILR